jgi:predicted NAD/FAD-binding protein
MADKLRIAIVGAGISGLSCAYALRKQTSLDITLFEKGSYIGGHSNTIEFTPKGFSTSFPIDTGFLVFNDWTYPGLIAFFKELDVPVAKSEMSFSVSLKTNHHQRLEWAGDNLNTLFAQRKNIFSPRFLHMLVDIVRFNQAGKNMCAHPASINSSQQLESVEDFLNRKTFSSAFRDWYLLPMIGAIWSCSLSDMLKFPIQTLMQFCNNHGLLNIINRPQWRTVAGGSKEYVSRAIAALKEHHVHIDQVKVDQCHRLNNSADGPIQLQLNNGEKRTFDKVIFACHSDEALEILADASNEENHILSAVAYKQNTAYVHEDRQLLPQLSEVWAAWNYTCEQTPGNGMDQSPAVCVHYLINKLQPLPDMKGLPPVVVSLNPQIKPAVDKTHATIEYSHPIFNQAAIQAQEKLHTIQGVQHTYFCGAWTRYGFHEDGFQSGKSVAQSLLDSLKLV